MFLVAPKVHVETSISASYGLAHTWICFVKFEGAYSRSNFGQFLGDYSGVGSGMSTRPPKGTSLRQNTHFEPSCTFLRLSVRAGREPEKTGKKKKKK
jgi:hypothetical protein